MISKNVGVKESNVAEVKAILEALRLFSRSFQSKLIVESDSGNAVKWASILSQDLGDFMRSRNYLPI